MHGLIFVTWEKYLAERFGALLLDDCRRAIGEGAGVTPPLFECGAISGDPYGPNLVYDSPRQLCSLLHGSIEGAAMRYGERVRVREETCMQCGAPTCTFAIQFLRPSVPPRRPAGAAATSYPRQTSWPAGGQAARREAEHLLADAVYAVLPTVNGLTLSEVQDRLRENSPDISDAARPFLVLEALNHLYHAGWVATTANEPGDTLSNRRYWRVAPVGH